MQGPGFDAQHQAEREGSESSCGHILLGMKSGSGSSMLCIFTTNPGSVDGLRFERVS